MCFLHEQVLMGVFIRFRESGSLLSEALVLFDLIEVSIKSCLNCFQHPYPKKLDLPHLLTLKVSIRKTCIIVKLKARVEKVQKC